MPILLTYLKINLFYYNMIKIIATIGPSTLDYNILKEIIKSGVDIVRINTKYGDFKQYYNIIENVKKINLELKRKCKVLIDVKKKKSLTCLQNIKFDYLAIAFTDSVIKINEYKNKLNNPKVKIVSKIENKKGLINLNDIILNSDALMVARGDLGKHTPLQKLPLRQKEIIKLCKKNNCFVIVATEMLLSMQHNRKPTRAEVSDVANAVIDGADAVMLSEETTIGKYPIETVKFMKSVIIETEKWIKKNN